MKSPLLNEVNKVTLSRKLRHTVPLFRAPARAFGITFPRLPSLPFPLMSSHASHDRRLW